MTSPARLLELVERFSGTTVLLLGDLVLDRFVLGTPKRISREAPVIILRLCSVRRRRRVSDRRAAGERAGRHSAAYA